MAYGTCGGHTHTHTPTPLLEIDSWIVLGFSQLEDVYLSHQFLFISAGAFSRIELDLFVSIIPCKEKRCKNVTVGRKIINLAKL